MPSLILASQSPYRRQQLENFGLKFKAEKPSVDEEALKKTGPSDLTELTRYLSEQKARSLLAQHPDAYILGSDQLAEVDGERLDKPGTIEKARAQLQRLSGKEHRLITSLAIVHGDEIKIYTDVTRIRFRNLSDRLIDDYLKVDQPLDCAGSYKIEKAGLSLVESLKTDDPSAIQGLPMLSLLRGLEEYKLSVSDFWGAK